MYEDKYSWTLIMNLLGIKYVAVRQVWKRWRRMWCRTSVKHKKPVNMLKVCIKACYNPADTRMGRHDLRYRRVSGMNDYQPTINWTIYKLHCVKHRLWVPTSDLHRWKSSDVSWNIHQISGSLSPSSIIQGVPETRYLILTPRNCAEIGIKGSLIRYYDIWPMFG